MNSTFQKISAFIILIGLVSCSTQVSVIPNQEGNDDDADKLLVVDCLLPGKIKKLGAGMTFVTARQPAKVTALVCENRGGEYVAYDQANHASALKIWLPAAKEGNVEAQTYVGEIYEKGYGIEPDYKAAVHWYEQAAKQGDARAKLNLGYLYEKGLGVEKDVAKALLFYRSASALSDTSFGFVADLSAEKGLSATDLRTLTSNLKQEQATVLKLEKQLQQTQSKLKSKEKILAANQRQLQRTRITLSEVSTSVAAGEDLHAVQQQLQKKELELARQEKEIAQLNTQLTEAKQAVAAAKPKASLALSAPSIYLSRPLLVSVRGQSTVEISPQTRFRDVSGRVYAPGGLKTLSINGDQVAFDANSMFSTRLEIREATTPVSIVALDNLGESVEVSFTFSVEKPLMQPVATTPMFSAADINDVRADYSNYYALVIGNNDYKQYDKLKTAVNDAKEVSDILSNRYGFKTTTLINASRFMTLATLNRLSKRLTEKDNLLIYYAGHGEVDKEGVGYWIPVDASQSSKRRWISNQAITDLISAMKVKRVLVVADSCYSGTLTTASLPTTDDTLSKQDRIRWMRTLARSKSRIALTSGGLKPVSDVGPGDHSVFAQSFIDALNDNLEILEGQRLHKYITARVSSMREAEVLKQIPQYAPIRHAGHQSGEFFFFPRTGAS